MSSVPPAANVPVSTPRGDVVEGAALPGADRHDLRQDVEVDPGLGGDQHPLDRGDEIGVAEILRRPVWRRRRRRSARHERRSSRDRLEERPAFRERRRLAPPTITVMFGGRPLTGASKTRRRVARSLRHPPDRRRRDWSSGRYSAPPRAARRAAPPAASNRPPRPRFGPGSEVNTTSRAHAPPRRRCRPPRRPARPAPPSPRAARRYTVSRCPAATRHRAIGVPIVPVPTKPIRMQDPIASLLLQGICSHDAAAILAAIRTLSRDSGNF